MEGNATSLKRKEQTPVELDKENEKLMYYIYEAVQARYSDRELAKYLNSKIIGEKRELRRKIFAFLRDLQIPWKPSEKQMKALEQAKISAIAGNYIIKDGLCSLYEQLKKL